MSTGADSARVETLLGSAHRALTQACLITESWSDQGYCDDLYPIRLEVARVLRDVLRRRRSTQGAESIAGQLSIDDVLSGHRDVYADSRRAMQRSRS
jgi:hypothetical protein